MTGNPNLSANFVATSENMYSSEYLDYKHNRWQVDVAGSREQVRWFVDNRPCHCHADSASADNRVFLPDQHTQPEPQPAMPVDKDAAALNVTITLKELALGDQPFVVTFEIDPEVNIGAPVHHHTFNLQGSDITARVNYSCNNGTVKVSLSGDDKTITSGPSKADTLIVPKATQASAWVVTVERGQGNPVVYSLTGDFMIGTGKQKINMQEQP
jgi:hypothetical protein